jgi:hypothetical protein
VEVSRNEIPGNIVVLFPVSRIRTGVRNLPCITQFLPEDSEREENDIDAAADDDQVLIEVEADCHAAAPEATDTITAVDEPATALPEKAADAAPDAVNILFAAADPSNSAETVAVDAQAAVTVEPNALPWKLAVPTADPVREEVTIILPCAANVPLPTAVNEPVLLREPTPENVADALAVNVDVDTLPLVDL